MADTITTDKVLNGFKAQLQQMYAEKCVIEDQIADLKSHIEGFVVCTQVQEAIEKQKAEELEE